eukprot:753140-Hanusia_phi.AAC.4
MPPAPAMPQGGPSSHPAGVGAGYRVGGVPTPGISPHKTPTYTGWGPRAISTIGQKEGKQGMRG